MSALHRFAHRRLTLVVTTAGLLASVGVLTGCGGSSPTQTKTIVQVGKPTAGQSNPDVGGPAVGVTTRQSSGHTATTSHDTGAARGKEHSATSADGKGHGHPGGSSSRDVIVPSSKVQKARPTPVGLRDNDGQPTNPTLNPCTLVSAAQAQKIIGGAAAHSAEAPLGPTCIYRFNGSKTEVTLAVQTATLASLTRHLARRKQVSIGGHAAVCGTLGQPTMYLPLTGTEVLSISAPCAVAQRFAATALPQLEA